MDEPLAGKSIEAVAHGRHADAQFRSEPGGFKALPRWPDASEKAPPERIVGWLENIGGTNMFSPRPIDRSLLSSFHDRACARRLPRYLQVRPCRQGSTAIYTRTCRDWAGGIGRE